MKSCNHTLQERLGNFSYQLVRHKPKKVERNENECFREEISTLERVFMS
jgi:hypothetical protein